MFLFTLAYFGSSQGITAIILYSVPFRCIWKILFIRCSFLISKRIHQYIYFTHIVPIFLNLSVYGQKSNYPATLCLAVCIFFFPQNYRFTPTLRFPPYSSPRPLSSTLPSYFVDNTHRRLLDRNFLVSHSPEISAIFICTHGFCLRYS